MAQSMIRQTTGRRIKRWRHPNKNMDAVLYKQLGKTPSTIWLFESAYNYIWLYKHFMSFE